MISGGPIGFDDEEVKFTLAVLRDGAQLQWEAGQFEKRQRVVREILLGCTSEVWKTDEWALGLDGSSSKQHQQQLQEDPLFTKKGWNKINYPGGYKNQLCSLCTVEADDFQSLRTGILQ